MAKRTPQIEPLAGPPPKRTQCTGKTKTGKRCKRLALDGAKHCAVHLGAPVGRSAKLTEDVAKTIIAILELGGYVEVAAAAAGISKSTFYDWLERGAAEGTKKVDEPYRRFRERIEQARAKGETEAIALIQRHAMKDWKAAAWMLERQFPDRWAGPRGRGLTSSVHPDDFAGGETSSGQDTVDDQVGPDGRPL